MKTSVVFISVLTLILILVYMLKRKFSSSDFLLSPEKSRYLKGCLKSLILISTVIVMNIFFPLLRIPDEYATLARQLMKVSMILGVSWLLVNMTFMLKSAILTRYRIDDKDNLKARSMHTQINMFTKILLIIIATLSLISLLMTFETFRKTGTALIASAGIAGLIVGLSAQKTLTAILSGLQLAITQPIRIDDVMVVENEWGKIEEITLTYVVVRIWDLRRLILPTTHFLEKPFQNWTRVSADILGTVYIYADYTLPIEEVRKELLKILEKEAEWDGKTWGLQITNMTGSNVELRALMG